MCQVCENPFRICQWGNTGFYIDKNEKGEYRFKMEVEKVHHKYDIKYSTPISYCPYCGRDLTLEMCSSHDYWEYLKTVDDPDALRILLELGKKWQQEDKDLNYELKKYMKW